MYIKPTVCQTRNGTHINLEGNRQISFKLEENTEMYRLTVTKRSYYVDESLNDKVHKHLVSSEVEELVEEYLKRYGAKENEKVLAEVKAALQPMGNDWFRIL